MNTYVQETLKRQAELVDEKSESGEIKRTLEQEYYNSVRRCMSCQRLGEWTKRCGRCKVARGRRAGALLVGAAPLRGRAARVDGPRRVASREWARGVA